MNGAWASRASRRAISVFPTPVGPDHDDVLRGDLVPELRRQRSGAASGSGARSRPSAWPGPARRRSGRARPRSGRGVSCPASAAPSQLLHRHLVVRVDADPGGDAHAPRRDGLGVEVGVARRARAPRPARTCPPEPIPISPSSGSMHLARPRHDERRVGVGDGQERLQPAQDPVAPPLLGQLDRRPRAGCRRCCSRRRLEPLEEREGVGGGAGEAGEDAVVVDAANLARRCASRSSRRGSPARRRPSPPRPRAARRRRSSRGTSSGSITAFARG